MPKNKKTPQKQKKKTSQSNRSSKASPQAVSKVASTSKQLVPRNRVSPITMSSICGLTDPFCSHAIGTKYPDASSARSLPFSMHYQVNVTTDGLGNGAMLFAPGYNFGFAQATTTSAIGSCVFPAAFTANNVSGLTPSAYRIVSSGIRIRNLASPLNASGIVQIRGYASPNGATYLAVDTGKYNCDFYQDIPLQSINGSGHTDVVFRRTDEVESRQFVNPATTNPTSGIVAYVAPGFGVIVVTVLGGPATSAPINVEWLQHMELLFDDSDSLAVAMTPSHPANPLLTQAASSVSRTVGNIFTQVGKDIETATTFAARKVMVDLGTRFLGSGAASAAMMLL